MLVSCHVAPSGGVYSFPAHDWTSEKIYNSGVKLISSSCLVVRFFLTLFHYNVLIPSGHHVCGGVGGIKGLYFISEFGFLENKS